MKPVKPKLDETKLKAILGAERSAALGTNSSSDLSDQRVRALDYYMGDMSDTMPAVDGESGAVSTDVQDVVEGLLPIILDIFVGGDKVVEFRPNSPQDEDKAAQETDYVNYVFYQKNPGFVTLHNAIKDALLSKNCFVKWWVEKVTEREREDYEGLTEDAFAMIAADRDVTILSSESYQVAAPVPTLPGAPPAPPITLYNVVVEKSPTRNEFKIETVPPEEILVSKNARSIRDATYLAHVTRKPMADVIALYPDHEETIRNSPGAAFTADNHEAFARQTVQDNQDQSQSADDVNEGMRLVEIVEHYIRLALESDGHPRRYKIVTIGSGLDILETTEVRAWPFATGTPILMPHRLFGRSMADLVLEIQEIKTALLRAVLNNAYLANNQRVEISETHAGENTIDDLLNNRVGGLVRTKMPGGLTPIPNQSIGSWVMNTIEYVDTVRENRTGASRYNQGLDADSLNHTATGITKIMDAAGMRVKLVARVFAETLFVDMFRGIHEMLQEHAEAAEVFKFKGDWVSIDPREWAHRREMTISLPLGGASRQQLLVFFQGLLQVQEAALKMQGGPNGPMVSLPNVYATCAEMLKLAGKSVEPFFMKPPPPDPNGNPPPPNPEMLKAQASIQAEQASAQADMQIEQQKFQFEQQVEGMKLGAQRERDAAQFEHTRQLDIMRFNHDKEMGRLKLENEMELARFKAAHTAQQAETLNAAKVRAAGAQA